MPNNRISTHRKPSCDFYRRARKTKTKIQRTNTPLVARGFGAGPILLMATFMLLSGFYLFTVNTNAVRGENVNAIDRTISNLQLDQEELRIQLAHVRSQKNIDEVVIKYEMEPIDEAAYIDVRPTVALEF